MEIKEVMERISIAKPVASKPNSCSTTFKSFSELLVGAISAASPPPLSRPPVNTSSSDAVVLTPIRPKTVRVKPTAVNRSPPPTSIIPFSQADTSGTAAACVSFDDKVSSKTNNVLYKPLAKVVSKATISLLANMGNSNISHQQALSQVEARALHSNQHKLHPSIQPVTNPRPSINPSPAETTTRPIEPPKTAAPRITEDDPKLAPIASTVANVDRPSYDGYNWRKYGQKQVKGSEYPRSYYKCTHPNCQVKKKVERSFDGQIAEIVYKGEHNHAKPQLPKRNSSSLGPQGQNGDGVVSQDHDSNQNNIKRNNKKLISEVYDDCERRGVITSNQSSYPLKTPGLSSDPGAAANMGGIVYNGGGTTTDNSCGHSVDDEEGSKCLEADDDEPRCKRRKHDNQNNEAGTSLECIQEPRVLVRSTTEAEILEDGFRWRKYGQKVVRGNSYPRSYYKCTNIKCNVRKHVERVSDDPTGSFITTYEGKHNHEMPVKATSSVLVSEPTDLQHVPFSKDGQ